MPIAPRMGRPRGPNITPSDLLWWQQRAADVQRNLLTPQGIEAQIERFAPGFGGPEQTAFIQHGTPIPNQRPADPFELLGPGAVASKISGLLGGIKDVGKYGKSIEATHYGSPGLEYIDPSFYGSRPGSARQNMEYNRVTGPEGLPRSYAYIDAARENPESMLRKTRYDIQLKDLYDVDADPMGLYAKVKKEQTEKAAKSKYPYTPPQSVIMTEFEKRIKTEGFKGTMSPSAQQAMMFEKVPTGKGLLDQPQQGLLADPEAESIARRAINAMKRQQMWGKLEQAHQGAGVARSPTTGRYVGAAPGITTPQKKTAVTTRYMGKVREAEEAGIQPGYFYEKGRQALAGVTDTPQEHLLAADVLGPTSKSVGPYENLMYTLRASDQSAMGVPVNVGIYPNTVRDQIEAMFRGENPATGYKMERYSNALGPQDPLVNPRLNIPQATRAPKDMWEGYGTGWPEVVPPSGPTKVAFSDRIVADAGARINAERAAQGKRPLSELEEQELHWIAERAAYNKDPMQLTHRDTIQDALPRFEYQHSWEPEPGRTSGLLRTAPPQEYAQQVAGGLLDPRGKDELIRAMGGRFQSPAVSGPGVFEGTVSPGYQSRSYASHTQAGGIDPAAQARIDATELARQYMLAQDARAGHLFRPGGPKSKVDAYDVTKAEGLSDTDASRIQVELNNALGGGKAAVVPSATGYRILNTGAPNADFTKQVEKMDLGGEKTAGSYLGTYGELDWQGGQATKGLLGGIEELGKKFPNVPRLAEGQPVRAIAGTISDTYKRLEAEGKLKGSQKLSRALEAWRDEGLDGLRRLVAQGLAPAALLAAVLGPEGTNPSGEQSY